MLFIKNLTCFDIQNILRHFKDSGKTFFKFYGISYEFHYNIFKIFYVPILLFI